MWLRSVLLGTHTPSSAEATMVCVCERVMYPGSERLGSPVSVRQFKGVGGQQHAEVQAVNLESDV